MAIPVIGGLIGHMFGRSSLPERYLTGNRQSSGGQASGPRGTDVVELSSQAPKPLTEETLHEAAALGKRLANGEEISSAEALRLRQDRIFAALAVFSAMEMNQGSVPSWPGGFPAPNAEELAAAYRRLTQRLAQTDDQGAASGMLALRQRLIDANRGVDFTELAARLLPMD